MGMRGLGQITELSQIALPNIGVITNIGMSHIEADSLGSRDRIAMAKSELISSLPPDGIAVINADDVYADFLRDQSTAKVVTFGFHKNADFRLTDVSYVNNGLPIFRVNDVLINLRVVGVHHVRNAVATCAVASYFGITPQEVAEQLTWFTPPRSRGDHIALLQNIDILDDTYNAAPDSVRAALETLDVMSNFDIMANKNCSKRRMVAILGDMAELGKFSLECHQFVGEKVKELAIDLLITVGKEAERYAEIKKGGRLVPVASSIVKFRTVEEANAEVPSLLQQGDIVLIKGSRVMEMERLVKALETFYGTHPVVPLHRSR